jgi:lysophospholipase L1-like esterase
MYHRFLLVAALTLAATTAPSAPLAERPPVTLIQASKIVLVGDSTTAVQSGWGPAFCARHVSASLTCTNLARGGRSTYSYRAEGSWDLALNEMRTPGYAHTWVLIQFGHNDQPGKPERSTDLATEFPDNLRRYVNQVRDAGAVPVLVTPLTRRQFENGRLLDDLAPWSASIRRVAAELDVPLIDLNARSRALVEGMGPVLAMGLAQRPAESAQVTAAQAGTTLEMAAAPSVKAPPVRQDNVVAPSMGQAKRAFDYTHVGPEGAALFAAIMADELARQLPDLRPLLVP